MTYRASERREKRCSRLAPAVCLAFVLCLLFGGRAVATENTPAQLSEKQGRVLPDNEGEIAEILLHYDPVCAKELAPLYRDLFRALEPEIRIKVVCPSKSAASAFFQDWGIAAAGDGRDVRIVNVNLPVSVWARDRCIAREGVDPRDPVSCFVPARMRAYDFEKDNDRRAQVILWAASLGPRPLMSALHLEGGNVVANRGQVFVGANVIAQNAGQFAPDELEDELRRICGPDVVLVRDRTGGAPWCHDDMYLTPLDETTILVGSVDLADRILAHSDSDRRQVACTVATDVSEATEACSLADCLDDVAAQMSSLGYVVQRLPIVAHRSEEWMITYNNVLLDRRGDRHIVYMPIYHVPSLDTAAAALYRSLGYEVRTIDVSLVHKYGGAIRCVANVTQRNAWMSPASTRTPAANTSRPQPRAEQPVARKDQPARRTNPQSSSRSSL